MAKRGRCVGRVAHHGSVVEAHFGGNDNSPTGCTSSEPTEVLGRETLLATESADAYSALPAHP